MNAVFQPSLFEDDGALTEDARRPLAAASPACGSEVVNVASVPQRSPFRYPGGKTWLVPRIRQWLTARSARVPLLIEPFAGGGIISLTAVAERLADHVVMVELDEDVAAVWQTILSDDGPWLAQRIAEFHLSLHTLHTALSQPPRSTRDRAFATILRNRVNRGGILAPGVGMVKEGENGRGVCSRWYPQTLYRRIMDIVSLRHRITFVQGDGLAVMRAYAHHPECAFFIDPPYTAGGKQAGRRLYTHSRIDHAELFHIGAGVAGDILFTYDNAEELHALAAQAGFQTATVAMKNTHHTTMTELLIGRDLSWLNDGPALRSIDPHHTPLAT